MRIIAITESNEILAVNDSNRVYRFYPINQEYIDERNDLETVMDSYGYLYDEMNESNQARYDSAEEYFQHMIDENMRFGEGYFIGHDTSYICDIDLHLVKELLNDSDIVTLECTGCGGDIWYKEKFKKILGPAFVKASQKRSKDQYKKRQAEEKRMKMLERVASSIHWSGLALIQGGAA